MGKHNKYLSAVAERFDSWANTFTGIGDATRDKLKATVFSPTTGVNPPAGEELYHGEDMAAKICDKLPRAALRKGFQVIVKTGEGNAFATDVQQEMARWRGVEKLLHAAIWARATGGALLYMGVKDRTTQDKPLEMGSVRDLLFLKVISARDARVQSYYLDPTKEKYGEPEIYEIDAQEDGSDAFLVHESRVLRFDGAMTSERKRRTQGGWNDSVLTKIQEVLIQFNVGWQGTAHLLQDAAQGKFKIAGLMTMISEGNKELIMKRMRLVELGRSLTRSILLDEGEDYSRDVYAFAGIPEVLNVFMIRTAAAAEMPVTVLFGQSPAGMNATGESDIRLWYDSIEEYQAQVIQPNLERLIEVMAEAGNFPSVQPEQWKLKFNSVRQMSDKERAETEKLISDKDSTYISAGVLLPEEVALSRYPLEGFSMHTQIDREARDAIKDAEKDLRDGNFTDTMAGRRENKVPEEGAKTNEGEGTGHTGTTDP